MQVDILKKKLETNTYFLMITKKYVYIWDEINGGKENDYRKDYMEN